MRTSYTQIYLHIVWATWDREPTIRPDFCAALYACIVSSARHLHCEPLAIGGVEDHVHILVKLHPTVEVAKLVKELKGTSSHLVNQHLNVGGVFKWQGAYAAFSVGANQLSELIRYINEQQIHHASQTQKPELETCSEEDF